MVDDDESERILLESILSPVGYTVTSAANGADALERMYAAPPDLVVLDLLMPGIGGWDVLRAMRGRRELSAIPVIVLTAFGGGEDVPHDDPVIHKPVDADLLRELVATRLAHARAFQVPEPPNGQRSHLPRAVR
ncbi:MAG TPA: response regulator [Polyangiaceae bacterium]